MSETNEQQKNHTLTTRNLFNHFLLLHDFLFNFSKSQAGNPQYLDAQLDVSSIMNKATLAGTRFGYFGSLTGLAIYCLKSKHVGRKFVAGFLWMYWLNHFGTLGSYLGAIVRIPAAYQRVANYVIKNEKP